MSKKRLIVNSLSERQREVLKRIGEVLRERGYAPTVREICQQLGMNSPANVHRHLHVLQDQGFLRMDVQTSRSIVLTEQGVEHSASVARMCGLSGDGWGGRPK